MSVLVSLPLPPPLQSLHLGVASEGCSADGMPLPQAASTSERDGVTSSHAEASLSASSPPTARLYVKGAAELVLARCTQQVGVGRLSPGAAAHTLRTHEEGLQSPPRAHWSSSQESARSLLGVRGNRMLSFSVAFVHAAVLPCMCSWTQAVGPCLCRRRSARMRSTALGKRASACSQLPTGELLPFSSIRGRGVGTGGFGAAIGTWFNLPFPSCIPSAFALRSGTCMSSAAPPPLPPHLPAPPRLPPPCPWTSWSRTWC